ncbi:ATP-dependent DNA helicase RecQ [Fructilactobacillus florum 8D]|uniref:ATP-dependent DNA helicase RecQ n=1 Tax=Fructilactobacillus florum 8D TaxID=1221538 RepID=W9EFJ9_9LACO|nr:RecQ family ATP-dependent DNA helicase [Fructilactobacillus florum]EKK20172.1 ATP-dependent DNA helicase RecQ [Fructilactobacillus florum 2F]ETO40857.1 ATP-dependent DNA helicase RecQ [Fructilactobacillus florum 8D]
MAVIDQLLQQKFHYKAFRPGQRATLTMLQQGQNVLAILPTGAGKTLIYQIYGELTHRPILIISPLLALMNDQVERMRYSGERRVVALNSTLDWSERQDVLTHLNRYRYLFVSPEMLANHQILKKFQKLSIGLFVIDEAHCISQWAIDFRPDYLNLAHVLKKLGQPQTLLLTATASQQVRADLQHKLRLPSLQTVVESINRPNIYLAVHHFNNETAKQNYLLQLLQKLTPSSGIIYFSSKKMANVMATAINRATNLATAAYHADLSNPDRYKIQQQFMNNQLQVICATTAFGMGINKPDVRFVIHYHLPQDLPSYQQEIGRGGRDGLPSLALLLYTDQDANLARQLNSLDQLTSVDLKAYQTKQLTQVAPQKQQLLRFYHHHRVTMEKLRIIFAQRAQQKQQAFQALLEYINQPGCRRKKLLASCSESFDQHDDDCCDNGIETEINADLYSSTSQPATNKPIIDWREIITKLF